MKKTINLIGWMCVFFTILSLICTLLTTYHFTYIKFFDSYYTLQWCILLTMVIWGIQMFDIKASLARKIYALIFTIMAVGTVFFMYMRVY